MQKAKELDIYFVFLPAYSPDLNPIEFIWKSIKRVLSLSIVHDLEDMKHIIAESYCGRDPLIGLSFVIWKSQEFLQAPDMID